MGPDTTGRFPSRDCAADLELAKRAYKGVSTVGGCRVRWVEDGGGGFLMLSVGVFLRKRDFMVAGRLVQHGREIKRVYEKARKGETEVKPSGKGLSTTALSEIGPCKIW